MAILSLVLVLSVRILAMPRSWVVLGQDCGAWVLVVLIVLSSEELLIKMPKGEIARLRLVVLRVSGALFRVGYYKKNGSGF